MPTTTAPRQGALALHRRAWTRTNQVCAALVVLAVCATPWVQVNLSASAPRGLWRRQALPTVIERGMWVTLPVPRSVQPWVVWWWPLLKPVAAVGGDRVCVETRRVVAGLRLGAPEDATFETLSGLWIDDVWYGVVWPEAHGKPLPHLEEGCFTVEAGRVFLASPVEKSVDSRYFGSVAIADLAGRARPLFTWR